MHAWDKATGRTVFTADQRRPDACHVAVVRSPERHATVVSVDRAAALALPGVVGVFTADDLAAAPYGRWVRDVPVLAPGVVHFVGQRVAAVVAGSREEAEAAAAAVEIEYASLPAVLDLDAARAGPVTVHPAPWTFPRAAVRAQDGPNRQSVVRVGDPDAVARELAACAYVVDEVYTTPTGHQGYLEPQAALAEIGHDGRCHVWASDKSPYRLRDEIAHSLRRDPASVIVHPVAVGGDFGGKGGFGDAILCAALALRTGRPVRLVLRYADDLSATNPRHSTRIRVRVGCAADGTLRALRVDAEADGGAFAGFKPRRDAGLHGLVAGGSSYLIPAVCAEATVYYTNTVPRGHMRAPGAAQATFAVESALDELAARAGISAVDLRRRNLLRTGDTNPYGRRWVEARGTETLDAALSAPAPAVVDRPGWRRGRGIAVYDRSTPGRIRTSLRLTTVGDAIRVETPLAEAGAGGQTVLRGRLAAALGVDPARLDVRQVSTADLPYDLGTGGSRVTVSVERVVEEAARRWAAPGRPDPLLVVVDDEVPADVTSFCVQVAEVAVDPGTGEVDVLDLVTALDVGAVLNPAAHGMQVDGGALMGLGFALQEDLRLDEGVVFAASLGEFKLPSTRDFPAPRTVLVRGGRGVGRHDVKAVGEVANVAVAPAVANAIAAATGVRLRDLPLTAEKVWAAMSS